MSLQNGTRATVPCTFSSKASFFASSPATGRSSRGMGWPSTAIRRCANALGRTVQRLLQDLELLGRGFLLRFQRLAVQKLLSQTRISTELQSVRRGWQEGKRRYHLQTWEAPARTRGSYVCSSVGARCLPDLRFAWPANRRGKSLAGKWYGKASAVANQWQAV